MTENIFRAARRASDITLESAGEICEVSRVTYQELSPGFRTRGFLLYVRISRWPPVLSLPPLSARTLKLPMVFSRLTRLNGANS